MFHAFCQKHFSPSLYGDNDTEQHLNDAGANQPIPRFIIDQVETYSSGRIGVKTNRKYGRHLYAKQDISKGTPLFEGLKSHIFSNIPIKEVMGGEGGENINTQKHAAEMAFRFFKVFCTLNAERKEKFATLLEFNLPDEDVRRYYKGALRMVDMKNCMVCLVDAKLNKYLQTRPILNAIDYFIEKWESGRVGNKQDRLMCVVVIAGMISRRGVTFVNRSMEVQTGIWFNTITGLANHSCYPNTTFFSYEANMSVNDKRKYFETKHILLDKKMKQNKPVSFKDIPTIELKSFAVRDIKKGEPISITYCKAWARRETRRTDLSVGYGINCTCIRCEKVLPPEKNRLDVGPSGKSEFLQGSVSERVLQSADGLFYEASMSANPAEVVTKLKQWLKIIKGHLAPYSTKYREALEGMVVNSYKANYYDDVKKYGVFLLKLCSGVYPELWPRLLITMDLLMNVAKKTNDEKILNQFGETYELVTNIYGKFDIRSAISVNLDDYC